jgi:hypothetical protein
MSTINQISNKHLFDDAWLGLGDLSKIIIPDNHMIRRSKKDIENPDLHLIKLMKDPKYFGMTVKLLFDIELHPMQIAILQEFWVRPFPMYIASRGWGKSFLLAMYSMLRCIFHPGTKIVIVGAAFRQSKIIFEYMENMWRTSAVLRSIFNGNDDGPRRDVDRCTIRLGDSWAVAIPMGDGSKIRGLRAHIIIADEFASISPDIYETVVSGFAAVSASPIQNVKEQAKKKAMIDAGIWNEELEALEYKMGNQAIISGTADYAFKHFAAYWRRYKSIIESQGDKRKLEEIFNGEVPNNFNWKDYSIIRIPYELIPIGFMDDKQVARAKATIHSGIYNMEYAACFTADSDGFFKRSLIESCVVSENKDINLPISGKVIFDAVIKGDPHKQYVYGIDPASEQDNFSIVVLELHKDHSRVVYCWTTNRSNFKERQKTGLIEEHDFYGFCARKIRSLMNIFPPVRIGMDAQGGGVAIEEALHDPDKLRDGDKLIWPVIEDKAKDTDAQPGLHIIELVQFARADWTAQANHGLRKDLEDKALLFPRFDNLTLGLTLEQEGKDILNTDLNPLYDSLSECILEIEELKNELTTIVMTHTSTGSGGRDRWDTPEVKTANGRKGRLRKDRYSSLVIANMLARQMNRILAGPEYNIIGGSVRENYASSDGQLYKGPEWFTNAANDDIYGGIYR